MAVIAGQIPTPPPQPELSRRVVVKMRGDVDVATTRANPTELARQAGGEWQALARAYPDVRLQPYFATLDDAEVRRLSDAARSADGKSRAARFASYVALECPPTVAPDDVARMVGSWPGVESAYVEAGPTPPPVNAADDPRSVNQGYLDAAPNGIDARWAWASGVTDGGGVGVVDLERGWTLNHEDLSVAGITIISGQNRDFHGHGTAVLGELVSVDNTRGGIGIAPAATARVVSQWRTASSYNTAEAILSAVAAMTVGDVLLLEAQTSHPNASGYVPVEVEDAVFDAIQYATSEGIVVVEAGANGGVDLDAFQGTGGKRILNRTHADFRDSGAILVGAASSTVPHTRLSFSNYGSRIDCYAWGGGIDTCGDGWTGTSTTEYTSSFGGTSGASPIVTGTALLLQSWRVAQGEAPYSPSTLRALLSDANVNTPSANPSADRIGVMPNLRAVIERQRLSTFDFRRWIAVVWILFGVIQDGGGIVIKPGVGPVPIDPWGPLHLSAAKRDILAGLAATEMAPLVSDEASRRELTRAGLRTIKRAADAMSETS